MCLRTNVVHTIPLLYTTLFNIPLSSKTSWHILSCHIIQYDTRHHITKQLTKYSKGKNTTQYSTRYSIILHCSAQPYHTMQYASHHITSRHATPRHTPPHRTTPHRTAPHHTTPYHITPHRTTPQHSLAQDRTTRHCPAAHDRAGQATNKAT